jgi:hypothetical protein
LTKLWILTTPPSALLGSVEEPPGKVIVNTWPLPTSAGASSEKVNVSVCVPSVLLQPTVNVCEPSTAPAGLLPVATTRPMQSASNAP